MNDERLRRLFSDAVSDVEPEERLDAIRASVRSDQKVVPVSRSRSWAYAATGIVATAAVIGVVAYATGAVPGIDHADDNVSVGGQPGDSPSPSDPATTAPTSSPTSSVTSSASGSAAPTTKAYAVYYVGSDPAGRPVLFREFHTGPALPAVDPANNGDDVLTEAVHDAVATAPHDPDYLSPWAGLVKLDHTSYQATGTDATLQVALEDGAPTRRPADMSAAEAEAAVQQLVYTAQAAVGNRTPVTFTIGGHAPGPHPTLLGVDISQPVQAGKVLDTLSLVSISDPDNGAVVSGELRVTGVNNAFEGTVLVYLEREGKRHLLEPGIGGQGGNKLWPWSVTLNTSKVAPGTYRLVAENTNGTGQGKVPVDDRVVIVK
jgi:hypothetical protein